MTAGRGVRSALVAALVAIAIGIAPPTASPAVAASDPLRTEAHATYTLDPDAGRVHVAIEATQTNLKPDTAQYTYYYNQFGFALQPEATNIKVAPAGTTSVTTKKRTGYIEAIVRTGRAIYYGKSTTFTIRYDLVGGAPRSDSPVRIGKAFATFGVWAWGDPGRGTVEVRTPKGFVNKVYGDAMLGSQVSGGARLHAEPVNPFDFFSIIEAENRDAYEETRISFDGGVEIVVLAWPEDDRWNETVGDTLRKALPNLRRLIGLDWPVDHDLNVRERYTPSLEGYAGVFFLDDQRIDVSEDLDPVTVVHEASHAWLNQDLFSNRWIYEGLAEEYAWRALAGTGIDQGKLPEKPDQFDPGWQYLLSWTFPEVIRDEDTSDQELYGYGASFWVIHQIVEDVGVERMAAAFAAAQANRTAYPGAPEPEMVSSIDDWRRFIDLVEPIDEPDSAVASAALIDWVLSAGDGQQLALRNDARRRYRELLEAGKGWAAPWSVRSPMGAWLFEVAGAEMIQATRVLAQRDKVDAAAGALGLEPDGALRAAYEGADGDLDRATEIADDELAALAAIEDARADLDATPDLMTRVGLIGETPRAPYEAARTAFEAGDLEAAVRQAGVAASIIAGAAAIGQQRVLLAVAVAVGLLLIVVLAAVLLRRRRRRGPVLAAVEPSGTLAATPDAAPALASSAPTVAPPGDEGGPTQT